MKLSEFNLVLYKTQPAVVKRFEADKIEIELSGDVKKVREKDVEFLHAGPVRSVKTVLSATLEPGNLAEAADFFRGGTTTFTEIAELIWGSYPSESAFAAWKAISESPYFSATTPTSPIAVRDIEEAEAIIRKNSAKREEGAERDAFLARLKKTLAASKTGAKGDPAEGGIVLPDDGKFLQDVEALALGKTEKSKTLKEAGMAETAENAHKVLLASGYWPLERNPWPARHGKTLASSPIPVESPDDTDERLDLTRLPAFAIDNAWSADPDDAVSLDGDTLWVHVADPAATVTPDSPADLDARARGATLYVPEGAARMLSEESLAHYALGLAPVSRALSFAITFTDTGAIDTVAVKRTRIAVTRLTYAEASARKDDPALAPLFAIAERNVARRRAAGAVFIDLPEVHISLKRATDPGEASEVVIENVESESAADMVREMMLLAGEAAARFAFKNAIPFQYVSQEEPNLPGDLPDGIAGEWRKRRSMRSRKVGTIPADHAGLGIGMYSQVTSPLRRYGDLIAHQQLHLFLDGKPFMKADEMLERVAAGDSAARGCTLAERESNLHWILVHLARHPDWEADAVVVEKNGTQSTILVPSLAQEARVALGDDVPLNATIRVRSGNVRIPEQTFSLIPV
jgi:exoribonuclease-2